MKYIWYNLEWIDDALQRGDMLKAQKSTLRDNPV